MKQNTNLSARIRRRNKQGFRGLGTGKIVMPDGTLCSFNTTKLDCREFGDYNDLEQNHKDVDYKNDSSRKNKLDFNKTSFLIKNGIYVGFKRGTHKVMSKRFADNHQKMTK